MPRLLLKMARRWCHRSVCLALTIEVNGEGFFYKSLSNNVYIFVDRNSCRVWRDVHIVGAVLLKELQEELQDGRVKDVVVCALAADRHRRKIDLV